MRAPGHPSRVDRFSPCPTWSDRESLELLFPLRKKLRLDEEDGVNSILLDSSRFLHERLTMVLCWSFANRRQLRSDQLQQSLRNAMEAAVEFTQVKSATLESHGCSAVEAEMKIVVQLEEVLHLLCTSGSEHLG